VIQTAICESFDFNSIIPTLNIAGGPSSRYTDTVVHCLKAFQSSFTEIFGSKFIMTIGAIKRVITLPCLNKLARSVTVLSFNDKFLTKLSKIKEFFLLILESQKRLSLFLS